MPGRRKGKMKKLVWIALIMVLGLNGCACSGTCALIKQDWSEYWDDPGAGTWKLIKQDWVEFWN
jgi:hypothetical protein